jgi:putative DNA primase/helicase
MAQSVQQSTTGAQSAQENRKPTDDELRDRWLHHNRLVVFGMGEWRKYADGLWSVVDSAIVEKQVIRVLEDAKPEGIRPTTNLMRSVSTLAQVEVYRPPEIWDANPDLLVCTNGMLHIPSKQLRDHDPQAYQTTGVPYAYDSQAGCPVFVNALTRLPYGVVQFLQEFAGYCLTTDTRHEIAVWFWGVPGSGKSTIIEGFNAMLGDRADVLSLKQVAQSRFGLSNIEGKTLIYAFESPALYLEATDTLNAIVSGEAIPVERKYKDTVTVIPRAKILWAMNKLPRIQDAGDGIFRRVQIIRFDPLPETEKDEDVKEKIKLEGPGILNWALVGLDRLRKRGHFQIPPEIKVNTEEFQQGNDPESAFVRECCTVDLMNVNLEESSSHLYQAYTNWCMANGHKPKSSTSAATEWRRLGFSHTRKSAGVFWQGVEVLANWHP